MIFVMLGVCILVFILCCVGIEKCDWDTGEMLMPIACASAFAALVCIIAAIFLGISVSNNTTIDERIAMYEEENAKIEEQIATVVTQYQEYESGVYADCTVDSAITLVSLYPELKADTLVQTQIDIYVNNNQQIRELREEQINGRVLKWWLYFGG